MAVSRRNCCDRCPSLRQAASTSRSGNGTTFLGSQGRAHPPRVSILSSRPAVKPQMKSPETWNAGPVKPDVVLFGEMLPESAIAEARRLAEGADLMLCVGSSLAVHPVAALPAITLERGGRLAIVTKGPTPYDGEAELKLDGEVDEELAALIEAIER